MAGLTRRAGDRSLGRILGLAAEYLGDKGCPSSRLDAELLLAEVLGCERIDLYLDHNRPLEERELQKYRDLLQKRSSGLPVARILQKKGFWSLDLLLNDYTLVPRPETEILVEAALKRAQRLDLEKPRILEIGTGAGGVALALARELPGARMTATDIQAEAIDAAVENASRNKLDGRVEWLVGDLYEPVRGRLFDMIIMNPPYLTTKEIHNAQVEVRSGDANLTLDGGENGMAVIERLIRGSAESLDHKGGLLVEMASQRAAETREIAISSGLSVEKVHLDLAGKERVLEAAV
ncbi:MAG: peptide chain release factor N(5)-glutamine methyltransferase [Deltaproteobacteria bacterium]|nr:peptide chain release factor N(5)-glutamine methyltransferase [Deltaproteobacteria bacterium]